MTEFAFSLEWEKLGNEGSEANLVTERARVFGGWLVRVGTNPAAMALTFVAAGEGLDEFIDSETILKETVKNLYDGIPVDEVFKSAILSARALVEKDPAYSQVTARLLLHTIRKEVLGEEVRPAVA
ncbi:hypothetical protein G6F59_013404 [Rhizopus arrhizus]|nr:hypothetical protein G6F59_013404 [Rhizopus arrhizus]